MHATRNRLIRLHLFAILLLNSNEHMVPGTSMPSTYSPFPASNVRFGAS